MIVVALGISYFDFIEIKSEFFSYIVLAIECQISFKIVSLITLTFFYSGISVIRYYTILCNSTFYKWKIDNLYQIYILHFRLAFCIIQERRKMRLDGNSVKVNLKHSTTNQSFQISRLIFNFLHFLICNRRLGSAIVHAQSQSIPISFPTANVLLSPNALLSSSPQS